MPQSDIATIQTIDKMFNAQSIAVIGASNNPAKYGYMTLESMIKGGYKGKIYPINPKGGEIMGLRAYTSLKELPEVPDAAVIMIPVDLVPDVIKEAGEMGIPGVAITSAGFSEVGRSDIEEEIATLARAHNIRIIGPNIEGFIYFPNRLHAQFFPIVQHSGGLATMTQSGSLTNGLLGWANDDGIGISACINLGNQLDICESDFLGFLARDDNTSAVIVHLEGVKDGRRFIQAMDQISGKKPVVILKTGKSEEGKKSVASHTASLAGSNEIFNAVCRQFGVIVVRDVQSLFDYGKTLSLMPQTRGNRVLIISSSGGLGVLAVDEAELNGLSIPKISESVEGELKSLDFANPLGSMNNPIDLATIWTDEFEKVALIADRHNLADIFLFNFGDPIPGAADMLIRLSGKIKARIIVSYMGGEMEEKKDRPKLHKAGIPVLPTPERAIRTLGAVVKFSKWKKRRSQRQRINYMIPKREYAGASVFIPEYQAADLLEKYNIHYPIHGLATTCEEAVQLAEKMDYPVVLKIVSPDIPHKSDAGGVAVNLKNKNDLCRAFSAILTRVAKTAPTAVIDGMLMCKQAENGMEVIVGALDDPVFGPTIMFGLGGIYAEIFGDVVFRILPLTLDNAREMIRETKAYEMLSGARNQKALALDKLADLLVRVSEMIVENPDILELDLNPVRVYEKSILCLDARIVKCK